MIKAELKNIIIGMDIGKKRDYSAIVLLEKYQDYGHDAFEGKNEVGKPFYHLTHLEQLPLGTMHTVQVAHVNEIVKLAMEYYEKKPILVIDSSGVGDHHFDSFMELGVNVYGVTIHGGQNITYSKRVYNVGKESLKACLEVLMENRRIMFAEDLPFRTQLIKELMTFSWKQTDTGHFKFEHLKSGDKDDVVMALMVAAWFAEKGLREVKASNLKRKLGL